MKTLIAAILVSIASSAQASYYATHCSSASGDVKWESGHNSNTLTFKYYEGQDSHSEKASLSDVEIKLNNKKILRQNEVNDCQLSRMYSKTRVYAATVTITPSADLPDLFEGKIEGDKIITDVICHEEMSSLMYCPENLIKIRTEDNL